ncbi:FAD/NAD(P)-binding protein [Burkholderia gladioli]|uniref:FAD/NAD(P)-binding protein n=1 Tax=Burkholderia gladioli TaxID=28095 RepID=UPI00163F3588|nr:FAD/NAD(P)-binding protein [Burkholderia gladioli]MBJ9677428.1 FAD/NAD(P)-binding protein [Burkholderia gladioli]MDN7465719.1 FAD/NAD(P)-binding protein [Burkholderia gladioli]
MTTIAIIGAGFCGATLAMHWLRSPPVRPLRLLLINRSGAMARGVAYGTRTLDHLLNVPAGRMSADEADVDDFHRYAQQRDVRHTRASFVPRRLYGDYLEARLTERIERACEGVSFRSVVGSAVAIAPPRGERPAAITMADGEVIHADCVVISNGNQMRGEPPAGSVPREVLESGRYVSDPWRPGALNGIDGAAPVLLVGSGLTMVDVVLGLRARGHTAPIRVVSRHGLLPQAHREMDAPPHYDGRLAAAMLARPEVRHYLRMMREALAEAAIAGRDWRDVIGSIREATPLLWRRLADRERRRFLRHLRAYWDVHRHRCAPGPAALLHAEFERGALVLTAGRVTGYAWRPDSVEVAVRRRGADVPEPLRVAAVINCTGPAPDFGDAADSLFGRLHADGLLRRDAIGMGFAVADSGAVLDASGTASDWLYYVGPLLQARDWEATAVPELRRHVRRLAETLVLPQRERVAG